MIRYHLGASALSFRSDPRSLTTRLPAASRCFLNGCMTVVSPGILLSICVPVSASAIQCAHLHKFASAAVTVASIFCTATRMFTSASLKQEEPVVCVSDHLTALTHTAVAAWLAQLQSVQQTLQSVSEPQSQGDAPPLRPHRRSLLLGPQLCSGTPARELPAVSARPP